jgi:glycosyltransferase involved in cell wall biosynthesis
MKIAIDTQTTLGQPTGFGFYVSNLVNELRKIKSGHEFLLIRPQSEKDFSTPLRFLWDQITFPRKAQRAGADLIHQPCFSTPFIFKGPRVVTVHDIISVLFPENLPFASRIFYSKWMPYSYRAATEVITSSQATKDDIKKVLHIPEEKITIIYLACDEEYKKKLPREAIQAVKVKYKLPEDYLLHIGTLEPRKNLSFLVDVFNEAIKDEKNQNLSLVITGKKGWYYQGLFKKIIKLGLQDKVVFTGYFDEKDKAALYQGSKIFVFPSLYEGFGLPPLEAMASGVPVISSNTSSLPEVVGDAGILVSPTDNKAWVEAITRVNTNPTLRSQMIEKNIKQVAKFSWEKTARQNIEVYERAYKVFNEGTK